MDVKQHSDGSLSLRLARVGPLMIAVPETDIMNVVQWIEPTPLPFSSTKVLGVVSVQGRMFTVLDTASLLQVNPERPASIMALRGPEQLALAIDAASELIQIQVEEIRPATESVALIIGTVDKNEVTVHLLATQKLFPATLQGQERRRRRF